MSDPNAPFERAEYLNKPGIVGARWWHRGLQDEEKAMTRRGALVALAVTTTALAGVCALGAAISAAARDDFAYGSRDALELQRTYGWDFGAAGIPVVFNGVTTAPFDSFALDRLEMDVRPPQYLAWHVTTLFESLNAVPTQRTTEATGVSVPLKSVITPVYTAEMDRAYREGAALASLFRGKHPRAAVVVELPGPEAVAFAAGAASVFEPVFLVDNWPHPRGVVPAHMTLAAAAYYQPLFARTSAARSQGAPPLFVLDRNRIVPYVDESNQFDNRHVARVPPPAALRAAGFERLLYVAMQVPEFDDLNETFVAAVSAGIDVRAVAATSFSGLEEYYYGGSADTHESFWVDYPWARPAGSPVPPAVPDYVALNYRPTPRATMFANGRKPAGFGVVPIVLAAGTLAVLGARFDRRGSWNRASSYGGG